MINHNQVGDGLCDCCDGTDEWETGAGDLKQVLLNLREMAFISNNVLIMYRVSQKKLSLVENSRGKYNYCEWEIQ